jgi:zinc transport system substrate-binding protein
MKKIYFLILMGLIFASCKQGERKAKGADDKPVITVTIEPLRYFTESIAGDRFTVVSMVPKGASPRLMIQRHSSWSNLAQSKAYFRIGYIGFEQVWANKLADNAPHLQFFDMSRGVDLIYDDSHYHVEEEHGISAEAHSHPDSGVEPQYLEFGYKRADYCGKHSEGALCHRQERRRTVCG